MLCNKTKQTREQLQIHTANMKRFQKTAVHWYFLSFGVQSC